MPIITSRAATASALLLAFAAAIDLAAPTFSSALPKQVKPGYSCQCVCLSADRGAGGKNQIETFTHPVAACDAYENKTCNYEGTEGLIVTGNLTDCTTIQNGSTPSQSSRLPITAPLPTNAAPTGGSQSSRPPIATPLPQRAPIGNTP